MPIYSTTISVILDTETEFKIQAPTQQAAYELASEKAENIFIHDGLANDLLEIQISEPSIKLSDNVIAQEEASSPTITNETRKYTSVKELHSINTSNHLLKEKVSSENYYTKFQP